MLLKTLLKPLRKEKLMSDNDLKKRYLKDIWILFPLHSKKEKEYLKFLRKRIEQYEGECLESDYSNLSKAFGSPQEIISSFYEEVEIDYILKKMKIRSYIKKIFICFNVILILSIIWLMSLMYMNYLDTQQDIIKYEEEIIKES